jgi:hypothetical protein
MMISRNVDVPVNEPSLGQKIFVKKERRMKEKVDIPNLARNLFRRRHRRRRHFLSGTYSRFF